MEWAVGSHRCTECGGGTYRYVRPDGAHYVGVEHLPRCESRPGGARWMLAVAALRTRLLTDRQGPGYRSPVGPPGSPPQLRRDLP